MASYKDASGKKTDFPFEIVSNKGRLLKGYFFNETSSKDFEREAESIWIKKKYFKRNLVCTEVIQRGTKQRGKLFHKFAM